MKPLEFNRDILRREIVVDRISSRVFGVICFVILTALGAYVRIPLPFTPVPITLQTFFALLSGAVLGRRWGAASQASYLLIGALGLPIFSGANSGVTYLFGPTGGYLIGFMVTSWITGTLIGRRGQQNMLGRVWAMAVSSLSGIYLFGVWGLCLFLHCNLSQGLALGFFPFILGDAIKIIFASLIFGKIDKRCEEVFGPW